MFILFQLIGPELFFYNLDNCIIHRLHAQEIRLIPEFCIQFSLIEFAVKLPQITNNGDVRAEIALRSLIEVRENNKLNKTHSARTSALVLSGKTRKTRGRKTRGRCRLSWPNSIILTCFSFGFKPLKGSAHYS